MTASLSSHVLAINTELFPREAPGYLDLFRTSNMRRISILIILLWMLIW